LASLTLFLPAAGAADPERGRLLYENHCTACHQSTVHIRANRRATSLPEVAAQITRWSTELKLGWTAEEIDDVLHYLDVEFYRLGKTVPSD